MSDKDFTKARIQHPAVRALGSEVRLKSLDGGLESKNFLLTTQNGRYVLKTYLSAQMAEARYETSLLNQLSKENDKFPRPKGKPFIIANKVGVIHSFIVGRHPVKKDVTTRLLEQLATLQARMHHQLIDFHPAGERKRFLPHDLGFVNVFAFTSNSELTSLINDEVRTLTPLLAPLAQPNWTRSVIHEDISLDNLLVDKAGHLYLIDFGESHFSLIVSDIAITIKEVVISQLGFKRNLIETFQRTYADHNQQMASTEFEFVYPLMRRRALFMLAYYLHRSDCGDTGLEDRISKERDTLLLIRDNT